MEKILGIDLGTHSIGWAIREVNNELENQIIDKGVLTFDKGVAEDKSGEHPMVQKRTEARGKRRNYQAEKYRKYELLELLIHEKMCPLTIEELNEWRHYKKGVGRKYPQRKEFIDWLRFDFDGDGKPDFERFGLSKHESYYVFRKLIIDETKTEIFTKEPQIIGRVLYQLVQRRGYNDGDTIDELEKDELSKTIMKGGGDAGAVGVNDILPYLEKYKTLGAALYELQKEQNVRIRKRYNLRSHYRNEIAEICNVQGLEHLLKPLQSAITWQRPLRSQKGLVGVCTFEQNKRRCPISHPFYEEYRTWVFINNLKIKPIIDNDIATNKMPLKDALKNVVYPQFFKAANDFKLSSIAKELKKVGFAITAKFPEDTKVISFSLLYKMREIFGDDWANIVGWKDFLQGKDKTSKYNIEDLWHLLFVKKDNKETGETAFEYLKKFAKEKLQLTDDKAETFAKIRLQQGYATLSVNAIKKILPYLQQGFIYSEAIYLANLPKVMGQPQLNDGDVENFSTIIRDVIKKDKQEQRTIGIVNSLITLYFEDRKNFEANKVVLVEKQIVESFGQATWNKFSAQTMINIEDEILQEINTFLQEPKQKPENHYRKTGRLHDKIFNTLMDDYAVPAENIKYLWHPSEQETYKPAIEKNGLYYLGSPEPISKGFKNPMALKTLHKLKRLVNYLIEIGKIDKDTRIVIEIARELNDANKREAIKKWQNAREKENVEFAKAIIGTAKLKYPDLDETKPDVINKFRLWFEQTENPLDIWKQVVALKDDIKKLRLWEEQKGICIYTGKTINITELFDGAKYDIEHTIPASMSFDNELKNLTLADKTYNQQIKGKKLPSECPNYENDALGFSAILPRLDFIKNKVEHYEMLYDRYKYFAKNAQTKTAKDNNIVDKHIAKMHLDYWRYKLQTFTTNEYKAGWRNSQLRDTQTITKYALPYLKTVFNKVEVQKGNITADFRKIYKIQPRFEKKERTKHSHHAIDAAVLTLIPPATIRDKILFRFNEANENKQGYHEKPKQWDNFHQQHILSIEEEVLINYQPQHRTLTPTYKKERKRGKIQYNIVEHLPLKFNKKREGVDYYKINIDDKGYFKIPKILEGDSIRGQLHADSFYAAIKQPQYEFKNEKFIPLNNGKGNLMFQQNDKRGDEIFITKKILITDLKTFDDLEIIIDPNLKYFLQKKLANKDFTKEILLPIWAFDKKQDKNGNTISPIRHIRCKVKGGGGGFISKPAIIRERKDFLSAKPYKNNYYAQNGETIVCALYQAKIDEKIYREMNTYSILDISYNQNSSKVENSVPLNIEKVIKKKKHLIPLLSALQAGQKVLFYQNEIDELKTLDTISLSTRMYLIIKFEEGRISFKHHLNSMKDEDLGKEMKRLGFSSGGASEFNFTYPIPRLRLSQGSLNIAIENKHFIVNIDAEIKWLF